MVTITTEIYYGMFSDEGNLAVHGLVNNAKNQKLSWAETYQNLRDLADSNPDIFPEIWLVKQRGTNEPHE